MKNRVIAKRISQVFEHQNKNSKVYQYWAKRVNCCGAIVHGLGITQEIIKQSPRRFIEDFELPNPIEIFPGYIPPQAGLEYLRKKCEEIDNPIEGDIVVFWKNRDWSHSGIYLGDFRRKRIMYNKDGIDARFELSDLDKYFIESGLRDRSFHRQTAPASILHLSLANCLA